MSNPQRSGPIQVSTELDLKTLDETRLAARAIAAQIRPGDVYTLSGELGAGKTTFARFVLQALGIDEDIPSPTFTLVQTYATADSQSIWHFDLYRIETPEDTFELGIEDAFEEGVSLIEWPEKMGPYLPAERLELYFSFTEAKGGRRLSIIPVGPSWESRLDRMNLSGTTAP